MKKRYPYFKGKVLLNINNKLETGDWIYGELSRRNEKVFINNVRIDENTLEWCTLQKDANEKDIFGGDILFLDDGTYGLVSWNYFKSSFIIETKSNNNTFHSLSFSCIYEIVGNKYDNKDLLKLAVDIQCYVE